MCLTSPDSQPQKKRVQGVSLVQAASKISLLSLPANDTWEWHGPCCLARVHRQARTDLAHTYLERTYIARTTRSTGKNDYCGELQHSGKEAADRTSEVQRPDEIKKIVPPSWTGGETLFRVIPMVQGNNVAKTPARLIAPLLIRLRRRR